MKKLIMMCGLVMACSSTPTTYTIPKGYRTCFNDGDCGQGQYCGFVGVDTYAVCKAKPHTYHWHMQ